jgi:hypothetical protein
LKALPDKICLKLISASRRFLLVGWPKITSLDRKSPPKVLLPTSDFLVTRRNQLQIKQLNYSSRADSLARLLHYISVSR